MSNMRYKKEMLVKNRIRSALIFLAELYMFICYKLWEVDHFPDFRMQSILIFQEDVILFVYNQLSLK